MLTLALLAWTALAFNAFGGPLAMADSGAVQAPTLTHQVASGHCKSASMTHVLSGSRSAFSHPTGSGQGCCQQGGCHCPSLCGGIVDRPCLGVALQPVHDSVVSRIHSYPVPRHSVPPLRPPIA